jgi:hypothetical protein
LLIPAHIIWAPDSADTGSLGEAVVGSVAADTGSLGGPVVDSVAAATVVAVATAKWVFTNEVVDASVRSWVLRSVSTSRSSKLRPKEGRLRGGLFGLWCPV